MAWKGESGASYAGGSGQMAVISELLHRKCNAAIPLVDVGTDVFAFREDGADFARIQVKTAAGVRYKKGGGYAATFDIPIKQLTRAEPEGLFFALVVRLDDGWGDVLILSRDTLVMLQGGGLGRVNERSGNLVARVQFISGDSSRTVKVRSGGIDLTGFLNAWERLPPLRSSRQLEPSH